MAKYASKVVEQAKAWLGLKEADGSYKVIIDTYNSHKPLARGYAVGWWQNVINLGFTPTSAEIPAGTKISIYGIRG